MTPDIVPVAELRNRRTAAELASRGTLNPTDLELLRTSLIRYAQRVVPGLASHHDYLEVVDSAIEKFLRASQGGHVKPPTALAYLRAIVRHTAIDAATATRVFPVEDLLEDAAMAPSDDEAIARFLDAHATTEVVHELLTESAEIGDKIATRVINAFLTAAENLGVEPTTRVVANRAGVSHTTVQNVLRRLQERLEAGEFP